jgi:hypothetical protein
MSLVDQLSPIHRSALADAVAHVEEAYQPWAVIAAGTIVYGEPDENSDLDLYVLHDGDYRQRVQRWFQGIPVEIFVNTEGSVLEYLKEEEADGRLLTADMISKGIIVKGEHEPRLKTLRDRALESMNSEPQWTGADLIQARYGAALLVEDALDRRGTDPESAMMLLGMAMNATLTYWFKAHGLFIPRHKDLLAALGGADPELARLLRQFWGDHGSADRWEAAMAVADRTLKTRGFFEWESERQSVASSA